MDGVRFFRQTPDTVACLIDGCDQAFVVRDTGTGHPRTGWASQQRISEIDPISAQQAGPVVAVCVAAARLLLDR